MIKSASSWPIADGGSRPAQRRSCGSSCVGQTRPKAAPPPRSLRWRYLAWAGQPFRSTWPGWPSAHIVEATVSNAAGQQVTKPAEFRFSRKSMTLVRPLPERWRAVGLGASIGRTGSGLAGSLRRAAAAGGGHRRRSAGGLRGREAYPCPDHPPRHLARGRLAEMGACRFSRPLSPGSAGQISSRIVARGDAGTRTARWSPTRPMTRSRSRPGR